MGLLDNFPVTLPRIGVSLTGVITSNIAEPTVLKNDGYAVDDPVPSDELNWIYSRIYIWLGYLQTALAGLFDQNFVMRDSTTSGSVVMTGAGNPTYTFDVDVPDRKVWIEGASYEVPATTLLADPVAPGNQRIDLVVATADSVAGTAEWEIVEGTADPSPAEPAIASNQVAIARYTMIQQAEIEDDVNLEDITERGAFQNGRMVASKIFRAGFRAATSNWNLEVDQANDAVNMKGDIDLGNSGALTGVKDVALTLNNGSTLAGAVNVTGQLTVNPSFGIDLTSTVLKTRKYPPTALVPVHNGSAFGGPGAQDDGEFQLNLDDEAHLWLQIPDGSTLTGITVSGDTITAGDVKIELVYYQGAGTTSAALADTVAVTSSWSASVSPSREYVQAECLMLRVQTQNNAQVHVQDIEITYTTPKITPQ